jgi:hypothetical protein
MLSQNGLFSAIVSVLLAVTVPDLKPDPQETSAFYLKNIYQLQVLAQPTIPPPFNISIPADQPPSSPHKYAIWVNLLWFLSLTISLACAMLVTLLYQWAGWYLRNIQPSLCRPSERARIRAFFSSGVDNSWLSWVVEALPTMIHLSLILFSAGLLIYLFSVNHTIFSAVVWTVSTTVLFFLFFMFMPLFRHESPFCTPLSSIIGLLDGLEKKVKETVQNKSNEIDYGILQWMLDTIVDDRDLSQLFECIPDFWRSSVVDRQVSKITDLVKQKLSLAVKKFLERTWSSKFLPPSEKMQQLLTCVKVADTVCLQDEALSILKEIFHRDQHEMLLSIDMWRSLRKQGSITQEEIGLYAQTIVSGIISKVQPWDDGWMALAMDQLGISHEVIEAYLTHGDSVLLANLLYITQQVLKSLWDNLTRDLDSQASSILSSLSKFNIKATLPELQHTFRGLWDEIVQPDNEVPQEIRDSLRHLYEDLNRDIDAPPVTLTSHPGATSSIPISLHEGSLAISSFHTPLPVPGCTTADSVDELTPGIPSDTAQPITQVAALSHSIPEPVESHGASSGSQHRASATAVDIGAHPLSPWHSVAPADAHAPMDASTSAPSPTVPQLAFVSDPNVRSTAPIGAHNDAQESNDSIHVELLHHIRHPDTSNSPT